jgi:hypothetical protein
MLASAVTVGSCPLYPSARHLTTLESSIRPLAYQFGTECLPILSYLFRGKFGIRSISTRSPLLRAIYTLQYVPETSSTSPSCHSSLQTLSIMGVFDYLYCRHVNKSTRKRKTSFTNTTPGSSSPPYQLICQFRELDAGISHRVRNIWVGVDLAHRPSLENTARALEVLSGWAERAGNLRTVTLNVISKKEDMHELMDLRLFGESDITLTGEFNPNVGKKLFNEYLTLLRKSWGKYDGQWAGVDRKLELNVGHLNEHFPGQPGEMVKEMHDAFGGELWIDGRLCYKDGTEVLQAFRWNYFSNGMQIAWFREEDDEFWGR